MEENNDALPLQTNDETAAPEVSPNRKKRKKRRGRLDFTFDDRHRIDLSFIPKPKKYKSINHADLLSCISKKRRRKEKRNNNSEQEESQQQESSSSLDNATTTIQDFSSIESNEEARHQAYEQFYNVKSRKQEISEEIAQLEANVQKIQEQLKVAQDKVQTAKDQLASQESLVQQATKVIYNIQLQAPNVAWNQNYEKLKKYKEEHGHIDLPSRCQKDPTLDPLCIWLSRQKAFFQQYCAGEATTQWPYRILALETLGVRWAKLKDKWQDNFEKLVQFQKEHEGSTLVPTKSHPDRNFSSWVANQRYEYKLWQESKRTGKELKKGGLTQERVDKLNSIGFVWNVFDEKWKEMFGQLLRYKEEYGDVNAVSERTASPALARWVKRQRLEYQMVQNGEGKNSKKCKLTDDRIRQLEEVGLILAL